MKMIYALPLAVVAAMAISGCSKTSENAAPAATQPAMQSAPSSAMSTHEGAMPAPASGSDAMSSKPSSAGSAN